MINADPVDVALMTSAGAAIGSLVAIIMPLVRDRFTANDAQRIREEERLERKEVALTAAAAATKAETLLAANTLAVESAAKTTDEKIMHVSNTVDVVHTLTNSTLTEAKQMQYEAVSGSLTSAQASLASLLEIIDLKKAQNILPSVEALQRIENTKADITRLKSKAETLRKELDARAEAAAVVAKQLAVQLTLKPV